MATLVRAARCCRLVLHPRAEIVVALERSDQEAAADDARDCVIEPLDDVDELSVVSRPVVRGEQGAVSQEGIALTARGP